MQILKPNVLYNSLKVEHFVLKFASNFAHSSKTKKDDKLHIILALKMVVIRAKFIIQLKC